MVLLQAWEIENARLAENSIRLGKENHPAVKLEEILNAAGGPSNATVIEKLNSLSTGAHWMLLGIVQLTILSRIKYDPVLKKIIKMEHAEREVGFDLTLVNALNGRRIGNLFSVFRNKS